MVQIFCGMDDAYVAKEIEKSIVSTFNCCGMCERVDRNTVLIIEFEGKEGENGKL